MWQSFRFYSRHLAFWLVIIFVGYWVWLDRLVLERFEQTRWAVPGQSLRRAA